MTMIIKDLFPTLENVLSLKQANSSLVIALNYIHITLLKLRALHRCENRIFISCGVVWDHTLPLPRNSYDGNKIDFNYMIFKILAKSGACLLFFKGYAMFTYWLKKEKNACWNSQSFNLQTALLYLAKAVFNCLK